MKNIDVVGPPKSAAASTTALETTQGHTSPADSIDVYLSGGRLQISANVGRSGLVTLKTMLDEILALDEER